MLTQELLLSCLLMRLRRRQCFPSCSSLQRVDGDDYQWKKKSNEELTRINYSARILCQLSQCFNTAMVGPRTWITGMINLAGLRRTIGEKSLHTLNPIQEQRLEKLRERVDIPFDQTRPDHQEDLKSLWHASFPDIELRGLISEQWKDMGWQGTNPSTDFRGGCGFISLENLLFFARNYPDSFRRILFKEDGIRAAWEYPFAIAGINVTFMLIQMLDLSSVKPRTRIGANFLKLLEENEEAFDILFCLAFVMLDAQWLAMHASYMEFNDVLRVTKTQLERELCLEDVHKITDLPAYNLLYR